MTGPVDGGLLRWGMPLLLGACFYVPLSAQSQEALPVGPVPQGMTVSAEETPYEVFGSTAAELRGSMRERGPLEEERRWDGYTYWSIDWEYRYAPQSGSCEITEASVAFSVRVVLPVWRPTPEVPAPLRRHWERFVAALRVHEDGHVRIGADAARTVLARIGRLTAPSCDGMADRANRIGHQTLDEFRARQRTYDADTGHGRTQGAVWPPLPDRGVAGR